LGGPQGGKDDKKNEKIELHFGRRKNRSENDDTGKINNRSASSNPVQSSKSKSIDINIQDIKILF
jgi:hypothetical protein